MVEVSQVQTAIVRSAAEILPARFQRVRARGWTMPPRGKCCSRPGRWGNPFTGEWAARYFAFWGLQTLQAWYNGWAGQTLQAHGSRVGDYRLCDVLEHALIRRRNLQQHAPGRVIIFGSEFFAGVTELAGRPLGCFCALNEACHVDTLLVLANELQLRRAGHDPSELLRWQIGGVR